MRKALFLGACDKIDLVLYVAKILEATEAKVLVVDATKEQKYIYSIPKIDMTSRLIEVNNFDVAVDCCTEEDLLQALDYKWVQYDYILIDTDREDSLQKWTDVSQYFLVSNYENYTIQMNKKLMDSFYRHKSVKESVPICRIMYQLDVLINEDYIDSLFSNHPICWDNKSYSIPFSEENIAIKIENQYSNRISLKGLTRTFKKVLLGVTQQFSQLEYKDVERAMKLAERRR